MKTEFREYSFKSELWKDEGPGAWYFVSTSKALSKKIRKLHQDSEEGWGRLKARVQINETVWNTSIWFDSKMDCYLVPIRSDIRKKEKIDDGSRVKLTLSIEL